MLIPFHFKNFTSFREEAALDLSAAKMTERSDRVEFPIFLVIQRRGRFGIVSSEDDGALRQPSFHIFLE